MSGIDSGVKPPFQPTGESHVSPTTPDRHPSTQDGAYKPSLRRTLANSAIAVNEFFHSQKVSTAKKIAAIAIAVGGATGAAGIAHHTVGFEFPPPIPSIAGAADTAESWAASLVWPSGDAEKLQKYEGIQQWAENFTDGEVFVPTSVVNEFNLGNRHITTFGGAQVSEGAAGYYVEDPAFDLNVEDFNTYSQRPSRAPIVPGPEMVVEVGYDDNTTGLILVGVEPTGAIGTGDYGTIVTRQATGTGTINADGSTSQINGQQFPDATGLSRARLATATPPPVIPGP